MITIVTKQSGSAVLICKLENDIGSEGEESQSGTKVIEVRGVIEETGEDCVS